MQQPAVHSLMRVLALQCSMMNPPGCRRERKTPRELPVEMWHQDSCGPDQAILMDTKLVSVVPLASSLSVDRWRIQPPLVILQAHH